MNLIAVTPGKITCLSGPSCSGKTITTQLFVKNGGERIEADAERTEVESSFLEAKISFLKTTFIKKFAYFESHLTKPTTADIIDALSGEKGPDKEPANPAEYQKVRLSLVESFKTAKQNEVNTALLVHMTEKAVALASLGKEVILDHAPFINDSDFFSDRFTKDITSKNLWCYRSIEGKDFKIEQQLKYVPLTTLMRNVILRNQKACLKKKLNEHRPMLMVLEQYSTRFVTVNPKATHSDQEQLGTLKVETLKKWIARSMRIDFFDINPHHGFKFKCDGSEDIANDKAVDEAIQARMEAFKIEMSDPDNAIDPEGVKVDANNRELLRGKYAKYPKLQRNIDKTIKILMKKMKIPKNASEVMLTYVSSFGIRPTIVRDKPPIDSKTPSAQTIYHVYHV